jgi:uncharacterized membrane protein
VSVAAPHGFVAMTVARQSLGFLFSGHIPLSSVFDSLASSFNTSYKANDAPETRSACDVCVWCGVAIGLLLGFSWVGDGWWFLSVRMIVDYEGDVEKHYLSAGDIMY